jgi:hypothetical protein
VPLRTGSGFFRCVCATSCGAACPGAGELVIGVGSVQREAVLVPSVHLVVFLVLDVKLEGFDTDCDAGLFAAGVFVVEIGSKVCAYVDPVFVLPLLLLAEGFALEMNAVGFKSNCRAGCFATGFFVALGEELRTESAVALLISM